MTLRLTTYFGGVLGGFGGLGGFYSLLVLLLYSHKFISIFMGLGMGLGPHGTLWASLSAGDDPKKIETTFCMGLGPHRTRWAALSDGDDPKKIETTFCIGSRHPPPLWAWDTIRHGGLAYRTATTLKKLKPLFISAPGTPPHPYGLGLGHHPTRGARPRHRRKN